MTLGLTGGGGGAGGEEYCSDLGNDNCTIGTTLVDSTGHQEVWRDERPCNNQPGLTRGTWEVKV
jgi:hypothetical protein